MWLGFRVRGRGCLVVTSCPTYINVCLLHCVVSHTCFRCCTLMTAFDRRDIEEERLYISYIYFVLQNSGVNNKVKVKFSPVTGLDSLEGE
jgi:hypothetical protein